MVPFIKMKNNFICSFTEIVCCCAKQFSVVSMLLTQDTLQQVNNHYCSVVCLK